MSKASNIMSVAAIVISAAAMLLSCAASHAADHGTPPGTIILHKADDSGQPVPDVPEELALTPDQ